MAAGAAAALLRYDEALGLLDWRADQNASLTYLGRTYHGGAERLIGSPRVVEDARLWMPEDASYRFLGPADGRSELFYWRTPYLARAVRYFLLPRRQTSSPGARWVFCLYCDPSELGPGFEVLSDNDEGVLFGRMPP